VYSEVPELDKKSILKRLKEVTDKDKFIWKKLSDCKACGNYIAHPRWTPDDPPLLTLLKPFPPKVQRDMNMCLERIRFLKLDIGVPLD